MARSSRGFRQMPDGSWWVDFRHAGQRVRRRCESKTEAERRARQMRTDLERGRPVKSGKRGPQVEASRPVVRHSVDGRAPVAEVVDHYTMLRASRRTAKEAKRQLAMFAAFFPADQLARELRAGDIERWLEAESERSSPSTANRILRVVRAAFRLALRDGLVDHDPTFGVREKPAPPERVRYLTHAEETRLKEHLVGADWRIVIAAMYTGLRRANVFGLRWEWIDWHANLIVVPKTKSGKKHVVPMVPELRLVLEEQRAETGDSLCVWPSPRKKDASMAAEPWVAHVFRTALKAAGISDFRFHDLRHTAASRVTMAGMGLMAVRDLLGHSSVAVSQRYSHLEPDYLRSAAAAIVSPAPYGQFSGQQKNDATRVDAQSGVVKRIGK